MSQRRDYQIAVNDRRTRFPRTVECMLGLFELSFKHWYMCGSCVHAAKQPPEWGRPEAFGLRLKLTRCVNARRTDVLWSMGDHLSSNKRPLSCLLHTYVTAYSRNYLLVTRMRAAYTGRSSKQTKIHPTSSILVSPKFNTSDFVWYRPLYGELQLVKSKITTVKFSKFHPD